MTYERPTSGRSGDDAALRWSAANASAPYSVSTVAIT